jgi:hypothetical protein
MASLMELLEREVPELPVVQTDSAEGSSVIEPDPLEAELAYTAQRAKEVFGYDVLHKEIRDKQQKREEELKEIAEKAKDARKQMDLRVKVREVLALLEICPYSPTSVEAYKEAMLDRAEGLVKDFGAVPGIILTAWILLSFVEIPFCWMKFTGWDWLWSFNGWVAILPLAFCLMKLKRRWPMKRNTAENVPGYQWERKELKWFSEKVDPSALNIALQVHEHLPEAEFYVDALCKKPAPQVEIRSVAWTIYDDDPFLVMSIAGENHYLAVWGEPEFERTQHP